MSETAIKLRYVQRGEHFHVDVFMGPSGKTLALSGTLVMRLDELRLLASTLEFGSVHTPDVEVVWEEP